MKTKTCSRVMIVAAFFVLALAGCGGGSAEAPAAVASIAGHNAQETPDAQTGTAAKGDNAAAAEAGRPQLRVDSTDAELQRLNNIWTSCLKAKGVKTSTKGRYIVPLADPKKDSTALDSCLSKQPLPPAETDPERNPHYDDDFLEYVRCINRDSPIIKVRSTKPGDWTWADDRSSKAANSGDEAVLNTFEKVNRACEIEAFGQK